jgi:hypothetical protein
MFQDSPAVEAKKQEGRLGNGRSVWEFGVLESNRRPVHHILVGNNNLKQLLIISMDSRST